MKNIAPLVAFFATTIMAAAVPDEQGWYLRRADEMHLEDLPIVDLQVTDERFGDQVFTGTAEDVYLQMKELKPELFANDTDVSLDLTSPASLEKRNSINCNYASSFNERVSQWGHCIDGLTHLMNLDRAWCVVQAAPACARVSCSHGCGIFLCNKVNAVFRVSCGDIPRDVNAIGNACNSIGGQVWGARDFSTHFIGLKGQRC